MRSQKTSVTAASALRDDSADMQLERDLGSQRAKNDPLYRRKIRQNHADALLEDDKIEEALSQYIGGVEDIEPSHVIDKLSGVKNLPYLISYLEELHDEKHGVVQSCHTALLLNCYARNRQLDRIDAFIRTKSPHLDVKDEIQCCVAAGCEDTAMFLARNFAEPGEAIRLLLKRKSYIEALDFVSKQPVDDAERVLSEFGRDFVVALPRRATEVLVSLCTEWKGPQRRQDVQRQPPLPLQRASDPLQFLSSFVDEPLYEILFLEQIVENSDVTSSDTTIDLSKVLQTLLELYLVRDVSQLDVCSASQSQRRRERHSRVEKSYDERVCCAVSLIRKHAPKFDMQRVLEVALQSNCDAVVVEAMKALGKGTELMWHYAAVFEDKSLPQDRREEALNQLLNYCQSASSAEVKAEGNGIDESGKIIGENKDELFELLLQIIGRSDLPNASDYMATLLQQLKETLAVSPMRLVDFLSVAKCALPKDVISEYFAASMIQRIDEIRRNVSEFQSLMQEVEQLRKEVTEKATQGTAFAVNMPCAKCGKPLAEFVLFLCGHSFHRGCAEHEVCPVKGCPNVPLLSDEAFCRDVLEEEE